MAACSVRAFLGLLDPNARFFTFQTVPEPKHKLTHLLPQVLHGSLEDLLPTLSSLNRQGAGIYVAVNATDGKGRRTSNIIRVRAIWQDDDDGYHGPFPLQPSMVVSTSPGKFQRYWLADGLSKEDYRRLMRTMVKHYGSDKQAGTDIARVLRVPGFYHRKAEPYLVRIIEASGKRYAPEEVLKAFAPPQTEPDPALSFAPISLHATDDQTFRIKAALKVISPTPTTSGSRSARSFTTNMAVQRMASSSGCNGLRARASSRRRSTDTSGAPLGEERVRSWDWERSF